MLAGLAIAAVARLGSRPLAVLPGLLSLVSAVTAGALWVNVDYGYYQRWSDAFSDLTGHSFSTQQPAALPVAGSGSPAAGGHEARPSRQTAAAQPSSRPGRLVTVELGGPASGLSRPAVVWLPGAYDDPAEAGRRFPVLLLLHGDPGEARGFVYGMHVDEVADELARSGKMPPTVIVMPTVWQGWHGQQCLDATTGPADETYLTQDVPAAVQAQLRVEAPGPGWVVSGLSEGGYCAADLALRHPDMFAGAAALDGYYSPITARGVGTRLFGTGPQAAARQQAATPLLLVQRWSRPTAPAFWVMSGTASAGDLKQAQTFVAAVGRISPVRQVLVTGGQHTTPAWRAALPDLLQWAGTLAAGGPAGTGSITLPLPG